MHNTVWCNSFTRSTTEVKQMTTKQPPREKPLTTRQQVALPIAAAIHAALSFEIFNAHDGDLSKQIAARSLEFADVFLAESSASH